MKKKPNLTTEQIQRLKYLDTALLSAYIRRTPGAIRNLVLRRIIPYHKPGGRLLFDREEIDAWIRES